MDLTKYHDKEIERYQEHFPGESALTEVTRGDFAVIIPNYLEVHPLRGKRAGADVLLVYGDVAKKVRVSYHRDDGKFNYNDFVGPLSEMIDVDLDDLDVLRIKLGKIFRELDVLGMIDIRTIDHSVIDVTPNQDESDYKSLPEK